MPQNELQKFGVSTKMLLDNENCKETMALFAYQAERAHKYYKKAFESLAPEDRYQQRTGIIMAEIYYALLKKIQVQNYPVLEKRVSVYKLKKLWIAWTTARREVRIKDNQALSN